MYSREIDGNVLTLSASGWTYQNTFVLYDYETESMWYHLQGDTGLTGISGIYKDRRLEELPSVHVRWDEWFADHPNSGYLDYELPAGFLLGSATQIPSPAGGRISKGKAWRE